MTFDEGMNQQCKDCGQKAAHHRMTPGGTFYCLEFKEYNRSRWKAGVSVYRCKIEELKKSSLPKAVGDAIKQGLTTYA